MIEMMFINRGCSGIHQLILQTKSDHQQFRENFDGDYGFPKILTVTTGPGE